jgi:hypothetical protein
MAMVITSDQLQDLVDAFEDTAQFVCDEHKLSGELVWSCAEALSLAKVCQLRGEIN